MILQKKVERRIKKRIRIKKNITGTPQRPRLTVYRSLKHVYAMIIDDTSGRTLVEASTLSKDLRDRIKETSARMDACKLIGKAAAERALQKNITEVVFDRNGFLYHGRVKAVADGAREGGLKF
ncbi:MAG: 50S ribosomal protein L18 [Ignavibacteria bacterium]|nr:50S ribosomal protein L18 [Ignavibacteria bacterium]